MILTAKNLTKKFGNQIAVNGVNISIEQGCFYSLLGPNGAGKSTTIHLLSTLLKADSGEIIIDNKKVGAENEKIKPFLGIVPQEISLYEELTALELASLASGRAKDTVVGIVTAPVTVLY